ncbi:MAG: hypothetical protein OEY23_21110 [Acidimicrobiia bacterium]|nr:hypothetical protein [Acidimicrobiia bacterium]
MGADRGAGTGVLALADRFDVERCPEAAFVPEAGLMFAAGFLPVAQSAALPGFPWPLDAAARPAFAAARPAFAAARPAFGDCSDLAARAGGAGASGRATRPRRS